MILRPATPADAVPLADLGRDSFCAAFAHLYRAEDLNAFLAAAYDPAKVAGEIADPAYSHCLAVDEGDGRLLGFCKMRQPSAYAHHSDAARPMALCQLYTAPDATGRGIGAELMDWALSHARETGADAVQLSVWAENLGAQRFYARYGFAKIADIDFWVGQQRDEEFLLELRL
ncbi:GNAT family N-acetyltransferase [Alteraurantiacibacter palmitatis]|uniref:GNAT family N-acetyltransferase n=1 Tax=Alteraurantiacibacter palmitatis TaxID=2054628 RepID=A0ABV7EBZ7_9SPHN